MQPTGPSLGKDAVVEAGVVFCPGVAGTLRGERLGRGGGSYDRALARTDPAASRCLLLYDDEVLDAVPVEPHDALVDYLCTPSGLHRGVTRPARAPASHRSLTRPASRLKTHGSVLPSAHRSVWSV